MPFLRTRAALLAATALLAACDPPADPEETTEKVRDDRLVLGWIAGVPRAGAPELEALERLAASLGAELTVVEAPVHPLVAALEKGEVHAVAGALPGSSELKSRYAMSRGVGNVAYGDKVVGRVIAVRQGENGFLMRLNQAIEAGR